MKKQTKIIYALLIFSPVLNGCTKTELAKEGSRVDLALEGKSGQKTANLVEEQFRTMTSDSFPISMWNEYLQGRKRGNSIAKDKIASGQYPSLSVVTSEWRAIDYTKAGGLGAVVPGPIAGNPLEIQVYKLTPVSTMTAYMNSSLNTVTMQQLYNQYLQLPTAYWAGAYDGYIDLVYYNQSW